jgi:hypothetical protein
MAEKLFLVSVADYYMYDSNQNLLAAGKTLSESTMEVTVNSTDVRGGKGAPLQYIYFNSPDMNITLTDTQFNLPFLALNSGGSVVTDTDVWTEETVTLTGGGAGTVVGTPVAFMGSSTIYGWAELSDGTTQRVTFTGSAFTVSGASSGDVVCVRYVYNENAAKLVTIPANIVPSIVTLVLDAQLASSDEATNIVGSIQIEIPRAQLSGNFTLSMTADGVSTTPLTARALAYTPVGVEGCSTGDVFAYVKQIRTSANWYDDVIALAFAPAEIAITGTGTNQTLVKAIPEFGSAFTPPVADLTFSSSATGVATVGLHTGLITGVAAGDAVIHCYITSKTSIDCYADVTVS